MKRLSRILLITAMATIMVGCASVRKESSFLLTKSDRAYLKSTSSSTLKIPAGLSRSNIGDDYTVPPSFSTGKVPVSKVPPGGITPVVFSTDKVLVKDDPAGYPGVIIRQLPKPAYRQMIKALDGSNFKVVNSDGTLLLMTVFASTFNKNYLLHLQKIAQSTRVYITNSSSKKLKPSQAAKVSHALQASLTGTVHHRGERQPFLKRLFS